MCESHFCENASDGTFDQHALEEGPSASPCVPSCVQQTSTTLLAHLVHSSASSLALSKDICTRYHAMGLLLLTQESQRTHTMQGDKRTEMSSVSRGWKLPAYLPGPRLSPTLRLWQPSGLPGLLLASGCSQPSDGENYMNTNTIPLGLFCTHLFPFKTHFPNGVIKK